MFSLIVFAFSVSFAGLSALGVTTNKDGRWAPYALPLGEKEVQLNIPYSIIQPQDFATKAVQVSLKGDKYNVRFGIRNTSWKEDAVLEIAIYLRRLDWENYSLHETGTISIPTKTGKPFEVKFESDFSNDSPGSEYIGLLPRNVLLDESNGYYNKEKNLLQVNVVFDH